MSLRKLGFFGFIAVAALVVSACAPNATAGQGVAVSTAVSTTAAEMPTEAAGTAATVAPTAEITGTTEVSPTVAVSATTPVTGTGTVTSTATGTATAGNGAAGGAVSGDLAGTRWALVSIGGTPVLKTSIMPTLELAPSGAFRGYAGCNPFAGTYQLSNGTLTFQQPTIGSRACDQAGVAEQEKAFMDALGSVTGFSFNGQTLTIQSSKGNLELQPAQAASQQ